MRNWQIVNTRHLNAPPFTERLYMGIVRDDFGRPVYNGNRNNLPVELDFGPRRVRWCALPLVAGGNRGGCPNCQLDCRRRVKRFNSKPDRGVQLSQQIGDLVGRDTDKQFTEDRSWYKNRVSRFGDALHQSFQSFLAMPDGCIRSRSTQPGPRNEQSRQSSSVQRGHSCRKSRSVDAAKSAATPSKALPMEPIVA